MVKIIFTIAILLGSFLGSFYFTYPQYEKWQAKILENETLELELDSINNYIVELDKTKEKIEENRELLERAQTAFPEDHDITSLYIYLQDVIKRNNLTMDGSLSGFSQSTYNPEREAHPRIKEVQLSLSLKGTYGDVKRFLKETEKLIRVIRIDNLAITGGKEDDRRTVSIQIPIVTYSY